MAHGIGIDIVSVDRIRSICCRNKKLLRDNLFSEKELRDAGIDESDEKLTEMQIGTLASKFAAKEAAVKAIGLPLDISFDWSDIVVSGRGCLSIEPLRNVKSFITQAGILRLSGCVCLSGSHSIAIVIGESA